MTGREASSGTVLPRGWLCSHSTHVLYHWQWQYSCCVTRQCSDQCTQSVQSSPRALTSVHYLYSILRHRKNLGQNLDGHTAAFIEVAPQLKNREMELSILTHLDLSWPILTYLDLSWPILTYLDLFWPILIYLDLSWFILTYLDRSDLSWPIMTCFDLC